MWIINGLLACTTTPDPTPTADTAREPVPDPTDETAETGEPPALPSTITTIEPGLVDPAVVAHNGSHLVGFPGSANPRGELLLFFPGTGATAGDYTRFLTHATASGFHVVGLSYDNRVSVNFDVCREVPTEEPCHGDARLEVLRGDPSPYTPPETDTDNAAYPRLQGLLQWLATDRPDQGWTAFLDEDDPDGIRFAAVTTAGHSQGGGHAAFTARLHEVARAILFDATEAAEWTTEPIATPPDRLFGVAHTDEFGALAMQRSWDQLGMPVGDTVLDDPLPATWTSHRYVIFRDDCTGTGNARLHNCAVVDDFLPPDGPDGPLFAPLWDALLGN